MEKKLKSLKLVKIDKGFYSHEMCRSCIFFHSLSMRNDRLIGLKSQVVSVA